jgi:hypothetical protein
VELLETWEVFARQRFWVRVDWREGEEDGLGVEVREGYSANGFFWGGYSLSCGVLVLICSAFMEFHFVLCGVVCVYWASEGW